MLHAGNTFTTSSIASWRSIAENSSWRRCRRSRRRRCRRSRRPRCSQRFPSVRSHRALQSASVSIAGRVVFSRNRSTGPVNAVVVDIPTAVPEGTVPSFRSDRRHRQRPKSDAQPTVLASSTNNPRYPLSLHAINGVRITGIHNRTGAATYALSTIHEFIIDFRWSVF